jgi:hypothetical protein
MAGIDSALDIAGGMEVRLKGVGRLRRRPGCRTLDGIPAARRKTIMKTRTIAAAIATLCLLLALPVSAQTALKGKAVVIRKTADFWTLKDGKTMVWVEALSLGQELDLLKGSAKGVYKGNEYSLIKVKNDAGNEGYVIEALVAKEPILGVVSSDNATLYSQPRDTAISPTVLPVGNIVALWPVTGKADFYQVTAYLGHDGAIQREKYILSADVSVRSQDVNVRLLLNAAASMPKKEQKKKVLETIRAKYSDTILADLVDGLRVEVEGGAAAPEAARDAVEVSGAYRALKPINVRDRPSTKGAVVKVLEADEVMDVVARTAETETIGSDTDYWYQISSPARGWVFGAFIGESGAEE